MKTLSSVRTQLSAVGLFLGWLVSPEALALFGREIGGSGYLIMAPLAMALMLAVLCCLLINHPRLLRAGDPSEFVILAATYGRTSAAALGLAGRGPVLLFGATAMLVSAGFAFNEIFLYWFPNFLFASLLLLVLGIIHLFPERVALSAQFVFVGAAILGLVILIIMGFVGTAAVAATSEAPASFTLPWSAFALIFLLFLGFDFYQPGDQGIMARYLAPVLAFLLLSAWAVLAVDLVAPARLAGSTLPHILVARAAGGEAGHFIIGGVIISGALSGVNVFLLAVRRMMAGLVENHVFPAVGGKRWFVVIATIVLVETMMMAGVAGDEMIDTQLRAALFLWLLYVGFRSLAAGLYLHRLGIAGKVYGSAVAGLLFFFTALLVAADAHGGYVVGFQALVMTCCLLFSFAGTRITGRSSPQETKWRDR